MASYLNFLNTVYESFGFEYSLHLSTRSEKSMGDIELWDRAKLILDEASDEFTGKNECEKV